MNGPLCLHCGLESVLTNGKEIYPHRQDLWPKKIWGCRKCDARCGCHGNSTEPLGFPANKETRDARLKLHNLMLDPLWKRNRATGKKGRFKRGEVYSYLQAQMGLCASETHVGMFTIEQCREAWRHLAKLKNGGRA